MNKTVIAAAFLIVFAAGAAAKIPAPQLTEEQKLKAEETKQKAAWTGKMDAYALCKSMDRVAEKYARDAKAQGKEVKSAATPPCADPGPFKFVAVPPPATGGIPPSAGTTNSQGMTPPGKSAPTTAPAPPAPPPTAAASPAAPAPKR